MKFYIYLFGLLFLFSCDHFTSKRNLICGDKAGYWDCVDKGSHNTGYCFYNTGKYAIYCYRQNKRYEQKAGLTGNTDEWKLVNDTVLVIENINVKILKLTTDSLIIQEGQEPPFISKFKRSPNQSDPVILK
ncbi:MAG: hypothetical protein Q8908_09180 [Bacteroidota bacterium]|nr:hypothetical protein [Bacteroidota bacterium]